MLPSSKRLPKAICRLLLLTAVFSVWAPTANSALSYEEIQRLIEQGRYEEALPQLRDFGSRIDCDVNCRGEVALLSGYCAFSLGQTDNALQELMESIRLRPRYRITETEYPRPFVELFNRAMDKVLCSVEIRITTPATLALRSGNQISTAYRATAVAANWIELRANRFGRSQRYRLLPGQLNVFNLGLEELHDFHAFDSLHLSLSPVQAGLYRDMLEEKSEDISRPCVDIGAYCVELSRENYLPGEVTSLVIEGEETASIISVLLARREWTSLNRDLAANPGRRTLTRVVKAASILGCIVTTVWAAKANSDADEEYERYSTLITAVDISDSYRQYSDLIHKRNRLGAFAVTFAATAIAAYVFAPRNERELVQQYERRYRPSGISLDVRSDYVGVKATLGL